MEIKRLSSDVISRIRSSFNINSVAQCVFELVSNSLDAKSTSIAVRINLITFKVQVADNGEGITKENLELLGIRYMSSKCQNLGELEKHLNTYGFRGEALSSIVEMCKGINVTSKCKNSSDTYGKVLSSELRSKVKLVKHRASIGTTVTVLSFLSNFPVRQQRVIQEIELEEVKKYIEGLVIINPGTSFSLRNDVTGLLILNSPKSSDIIGSFRHLHPDISDSFTLLKVSKNKVSIDALIHKEFIIFKKFQYVYVNRRPVSSHKISKTVNNLIYKKMQLTTKRSKHPLFETKRYPIFVLNIKCPQSHVDMYMGPSKSEVEFKCWDLVLGCIEKIVKTFFGLDDKKENKLVVEGRGDAKVSCGVSQVLGAVQACAYKRKSRDIIAENCQADDNQNSPVCIKKSKVMRLERKKQHCSIKNNKMKPLQSFTKDRTTVLSNKNSEMSGNYQIEYSGQKQSCLKPRKLKSIIKKPLAISVAPKACDFAPNLDEFVELKTITKPDDPKKFDLAVLRYEEGQRLLPKYQFDQKSAYSRLNTDEDQGKNLIMDMFLKSTQVFTGEDGQSQVGKKACPNVSGDTIEESNFVIENNIQDTVKGINTTMSINVNVKKKRMKDLKVSRCIQTSMVEDRLDKLTSKCIQTSQKQTFKRVRSNLSELTHQFDGFQLSQNINEDERDNYTILINTVRKTRKFRFVRKSEEMDLEVCEEEQNFRPIKICNCLDDDGKIFKFDPGDKREIFSLTDKSVLGPIPAENTIGRPSPRKMDNVDKEYDKNRFTKCTEPVFKIPPAPAVNEPQFSAENRNCDNNIRNYINFQGIKKQSGPATLKSLNICERSPYFVKRTIIESQYPHTSNLTNNDLEQRPDEDFQPRFKSTQFRQNPFQKKDAAPKNNVVLSPFFIRNSRKDDVHLVNRIKSDQFEYQNNIQPQSRFNACVPLHRINQYCLPDYHDCVHNGVRIDDVMKQYPMNPNIYQIQPNHNYCKPTSANFLHHSCCDKICCPPEINHQYIGLARDSANEIKMLNCCRQPSGLYKENVWHTNPGNLNIVHSVGNVYQQPNLIAPDLSRNIPVQPPEFQHNDLNIQSKENVRGAHDCIEIKSKGSNLRFANINLGENKTHGAEPVKENAQNRYAPDISDEDIYFERPSSQPEEIVNIKKTCVYDDATNLVITQNARDIDAQEQNALADKNNFNFQFSCTPDIFSSEAICERDRSTIVNKEIFIKSASCTPNKINHDFSGIPEKNNQDYIEKSSGKDDLHALSNFFDLASFGITKDAITRTNTAYPSKEGSHLEITVVDEKEKLDIIRRELLDAEKHNRHRSFSCENNLKVVETRGTEGKSNKSRIIVDSQNEWVRKYNETGREFYVNNRTGMVSAATPKIDHAVFCFDNRLDFVPKGMSPVLKKHKEIDRSLSQNAKNKLHDFILESYDNELMVIKWQYFIDDDPKKFFEEVYREKSKQFENGIPSVQDTTMKNKIPKDFVGYNRKMFETVEVIGQVDKKFIAVLETTRMSIILFDQHAVHERIRVEQFLKEYKGLKSPCSEKLTFFMPRNDLSILKNHTAYLSSMGLDVAFFTDGLNILNIPLCLQEKFKSQDNSEDLSKMVNTLLKEIIESLKETRGSSSRLPKIIQNVINLKACRGASKFGDCLSREDCVTLLNDLAKCNLPFQCAHGRPTLTPVLTLGKIELKEKSSKLDFKKLLYI